MNMFAQSIDRSTIMLRQCSTKRSIRITQSMRSHCSTDSATPIGQCLFGTWAVIGRCLVDDRIVLRQSKRFCLILSSIWNTITLRRSKSVLNRQPDFKLFRWAAGAMHNKALHQSDGGLANFGNRRSSRRLVNATVIGQIQSAREKA